MTVNSLTNSSSASSLAAVGLGSASASSSASSVGDSSDMSQIAKLMKELSDLAQNDPAAFKAVAEQISEKLKEAASSAQGGQADFLNDLADKFAQAAQTGDLSSLRPSSAQGLPGGHTHVQKYAEQQQGSLAQGGQGVDVAQIIESALDQAGPSAAAS